MIKILITCLLVCAFFKAEAQDAKIIIKGKVKDTMLVSTYRYNMNKSEAFVEYIYNTPNNTEYSIIIPERVCNERLYLSCNANYTLFEVKPGQTAIVNIKDATMNFSGGNAKINNYLYDWVAQYIKSFPNILNFKLGIKNQYHINHYKFPENVASKAAQNILKSSAKQGLKQLKAARINDPNFVNKQMAWVNNIACLIFLDNNSFFSKKDFVFPENYLNLFKNWKLEDANILELPDAFAFMDNFFKYEENAYKIKRIVPNQLSSRVQSIKNTVLREEYLLHKLKTLIRSEEGFFIQDRYTNVAPYIVSANGKKTYKELKPQVDSLNTRNMFGQEAYNFKYENDTGTQVSLSDFKGQYVFIDLWATWCGPCIVEIPYLKQLEEELHNANAYISFITISFDEQKHKQRWKNFLLGNKMKGIQLITNNGNNNKLKAYYNIKGIPRFILINPQGKIISANCLRPSNVGLKPYLENLLKIKT